MFLLIHSTEAKSRPRANESVCVDVCNAVKLLLKHITCRLPLLSLLALIRRIDVCVSLIISRRFGIIRSKSIFSHKMPHFVCIPSFACAYSSWPKSMETVWGVASVRPDRLRIGINHNNSFFRFVCVKSIIFLPSKIKYERNIVETNSYFLHLEYWMSKWWPFFIQMINYLFRISTYSRRTELIPIWLHSIFVLFRYMYVPTQMASMLAPTLCVSMWNAAVEAYNELAANCRSSFFVGKKSVFSIRCGKLNEYFRFILFGSFVGLSKRVKCKSIAFRLLIPSPLPRICIQLTQNKISVLHVVYLPKVCDPHIYGEQGYSSDFFG